MKPFPARSHASPKQSCSSRQFPAHEPRLSSSAPVTKKKNLSVRVHLLTRDMKIFYKVIFFFLAAICLGPCRFLPHLRALLGVLRLEQPALLLCVRLHLLLCVCLCVCVCVYVCVHVYVHVYVCTYMYVYVYICMYTHTHTHTHT